MTFERRGSTTVTWFVQRIMNGRVQRLTKLASVPVNRLLVAICEAKGYKTIAVSSVNYCRG